MTEDVAFCDWLEPLTAEELASYEGQPIPVQPGLLGGPTPCVDGVSLTQDSSGGPIPSGLEECGDGRVHRVASVDHCEVVGASKTTSGTGDCDPPCVGDAWCVDDLWEGPVCEVPVLDGDQCPDGSALVCDNEHSRCVGSCRTDADCGDGYLCRRFTGSTCGQVWVGFQCEGPDDTCRFASDCDCEDDTALRCGPMGAHWACKAADAPTECP